MKSITSCRSISFFAMITILMNCGGSGSDQAPDTNALLTSGTWKLKTVTVDGVNQNDLFAGFTLSFTATGYTAAHGDRVWPATGTWTFTDTNHNSVTRNDGLVVTINAISETELQLTLVWNNTTLGGGRLSSTQGNYAFVLGK